MEKNNKLIAEFMGLDTEVFKSGKVNYYYYDKVSKQEIFLEAHELSYNVSWDWLMPVIKKCRATEVDKDRETSKQRLIDNINFCLFTSDLLGTHGNIIDFIKWYERKPIVTTF